MDSKLTSPLQGKTQSSNQQAELHYVHHALIAQICDEEPLSLADALAHDHWVKAMKSELESIYNNSTWVLCDLHKGRKAIVTKWIYKIKRNADGILDHFIARLVAKVCSQREGIDNFHPDMWIKYF